MVASKDDVAMNLAQSHVSSEPGIRHVYRLIGLNEDDDDEPVKLLEVNENTVERGVEPILFGPHPTTGNFALVVVDLTPREFDQLRRGELVLPDGWRLGPKLIG